MQLENNSTGVSDSTTADCDQTLNFGEEDPESLESISASLMLNQVAVLEGRLREAAEENRQLKKALQKAIVGNEELKRHLEQITADSEQQNQYLEQLKAENANLKMASH